MPAGLTTTLAVDRVTPGTLRFTEPDVAEGERPLSIYLPKEMAASIGVTAEAADSAARITLTIERA